MQRKSPIPISRHTLYLYEGDFAALQSAYSELGAGPAIRDIVRAHLNKVKAARVANTVGTLDINLGEIDV